MQKVKILYIQNGREKEAGSIFYDKKIFTIHGNNKELLQHILKEPIIVPPGKEITAKENPELFFNNLWLHYKSAYLRITKPEEFKFVIGEV